MPSFTGPLTQGLSASYPPATLLSSPHQVNVKNREQKDLSQRFLQQQIEAMAEEKKQRQAKKTTKTSQKTSKRKRRKRGKRQKKESKKTTPCKKIRS